jgi:hypothetical protein
MPNNHPSTATIWTGQFTGIPNNGDYSYTLFSGGGSGERFNLIGNPYPSPIDLTSFVTDSNNIGSITGTLYFWRKTNATTLHSTYAEWTAGLGFNGYNGDQIVDPNGVLQTGQGFFVEGTGTGTTVNFNNSMRSDDHVNQFFKNAAAIERNRVWLQATNSAGVFSQTLLGYVTGATLGVDKNIDGLYINDGDIALTSLIDSTPYAIQGRPLPLDLNDVVPLSFKVTTAGDYAIAINHADGFFLTGQNIYLRDNLTGTIHDLNSGGYNFASDAGTFASRFDIIYQLPLGIVTPIFNANQVIIYSNSADNFVVNTGNIAMESVKVFDIRGRLLQEKKGINASQTIINSGLTNQVLLVQITSIDGVTVTKKVSR